jgi:hypothetical protein
MKVAYPTSAVSLLLLCLVGASQLRPAAAPDGPTFFDWKVRATLGVDIGNNSVNAVDIGRLTWWRLTGNTRLLDYVTGGYAGIVDADTLASARQARIPGRLVAMRQEGDVQVQIWQDGLDAEYAKDYALHVARAMHLVTTQVWPRHPTLVRVDIYVMPEGAPYSLARKVQWLPGRPLQLVIFVPGAAKAADHKLVPAHELYHVLAAFQRVGRWAAGKSGQKNSASNTAFEEVAASTFASCGALLADRHLSRPRSNSYVVNGSPMKPPLTGKEVRKIMALLRSADAVQRTDLGPFLGGILDATPVHHAFAPNQERLELQSPQGEQLLDVCRTFLSDPETIEPWLQDLS